MTITIHDTKGAWPFPAVTETRHRGLRDWHEISEERMWEFLEILPPIYIPRGFMVSEPAAHTERGIPIYAAVVTVRGRHFMRELPYDKAEIAAALAELEQAIVASQPAARQGEGGGE